MIPIHVHGEPRLSESSSDPSFSPSRCVSLSPQEEIVATVAGRSLTNLHMFNPSYMHGYPSQLREMIPDIERSTDEIEVLRLFKFMKLILLEYRINQLATKIGVNPSLTRKAYDRAQRGKVALNFPCSMEALQAEATHRFPPGYLAFWRTDLVSQARNLLERLEKQEPLQGLVFGLNLERPFDDLASRPGFYAKIDQTTLLLQERQTTRLETFQQQLGDVTERLVAIQTQSKEAFSHITQYQSSIQGIKQQLATTSDVSEQAPLQAAIRRSKIELQVIETEITEVILPTIAEDNDGSVVQQLQILDRQFTAEESWAETIKPPSTPSALLRKISFLRTSVELNLQDLRKLLKTR